MPGPGNSDARVRKYVGFGAAVLAVIGSVAYGWSFGSNDLSAATIAGAGALTLAVGSTVFRLVIHEPE